MNTTALEPANKEWHGRIAYHFDSEATAAGITQVSWHKWGTQIPDQIDAWTMQLRLNCVVCLFAEAVHDSQQIKHVCCWKILFKSLRNLHEKVVACIQNNQS
jgi:hypothetical protein